MSRDFINPKIVIIRCRNDFFIFFYSTFGFLDLPPENLKTINHFLTKEWSPYFYLSNQGEKLLK